MSLKTVWIVECKLHKRGRSWMPSLDSFPFRREDSAKTCAELRQIENPGWQYRAIRFVRAKGQP